MYLKIVARPKPSVTVTSSPPTPQKKNLFGFALKTGSYHETLAVSELIVLNMLVLSIQRSAHLCHPRLKECVTVLSFIFSKHYVSCLVMMQDYTLPVR